MNSKSIRRWLSLTVLFTLLASSLTACGIEPAKGRKPSPDWSRATYLGQFANGSVSIAVEPDGSRIHLAWPSKIGNQLGIHYLQLNNLAEAITAQDVDLPAGSARSPRLMLAGNGYLHLFWGSRSLGEPNWQLWHALLDQNGVLEGEATLLTPSDARVESYAAVPDGQGGAYVLWALQDDAGILGVSMGPDGKLVGDPQEIAGAGTSPVAQVDSTGVRHVAWRESNRIVAATLDPAGALVNGPVEVARTGSGTGTSLAGPQIGLSEGWVYVFWYLQHQSGLEAGTARTEFAAFPTGNPTLAPARTLTLYRLEALPFQAYDGYFPLSSYVRPATSDLTEFVYRPVPLSGERPELAIALNMYQEFNQDVHAQTAVALFRDGEYVGYEPASKTEALSQEASLAADAAGNLYMAWREGAGGTRIYFSTTEPTAREELDRLTGQDIMQASLRGSMEGLSGLAMLPFALVWVAPGFFILMILELAIGQEKQSHDVMRALLGTAIVIYMATKILLFPTILSYVPFSAWLDIPAGIGPVLRVVVPLAIFGLAFLLAWVVRKRRSESNLVFYATLVITDAVLTLMVYGVNFWSTV